jgi:hypothetical protein
VRRGVNDNESVSFWPPATENADEPGSLEDEMAAAVREADLALAEAGYLSKLQHNRKCALDFVERPQALLRIGAQAQPTLL